MTPRISLRSEIGINGLANGQVGVGPRSPDGSPFLFEVLGAAGPESGQQAAAASSEVSLDFSRRLGSTSLESCPPPALDRRRWTEAIGTDFMVRGPSYLTTRVKVPSAKQVRRSLARSSGGLLSELVRSGRSRRSRRACFSPIESVHGFLVSCLCRDTSDIVSVKESSLRIRVDSQRRAGTVEAILALHRENYSTRVSPVAPLYRRIYMLAQSSEIRHGIFISEVRRTVLKCRLASVCSAYPDVPIASGGLVRAPTAGDAPSRSPGQPRSAGKKGALDWELHLLSLFFRRGLRTMDVVVRKNYIDESPPAIVCMVPSVSWAPAIRSWASRVCTPSFVTTSGSPRFRKSDISVRVLRMCAAAYCSPVRYFRFCFMSRPCCPSFQCCSSTIETARFSVSRPGRRNVVRVGAADHGARPSSLRLRVLLHARVGQVRAPAALLPEKAR